MLSGMRNGGNDTPLIRHMADPTPEKMPNERLNARNRVFQAKANAMDMMLKDK
jgi:hypothetical protein